ncbi:MAG: hypothetical protein IJR69_07925 [Bacteroidaceae bacterium]|nr:hypothetical protein [Bacteroidaceae bacterium]
MKPEDKKLSTVNCQLSTSPSALRQALTPIEPKRLPTNFAYSTMQRIHREQVEAERRERIIALVTIVVVSVLGIAVFVYFFGLKIWQSFRTTIIQSDAIVLILSTLFCLTFFALLNHWQAKRQTRTYCK